MSEPQFSTALCEACAVCVGGCPAQSFQDLGEEEGTIRGQLAGGPTGSPERNSWPPCRLACPIGQDIPGYLRALAAGDQELALEIILRDCPLPSVLGRVCPQPCQQACISAEFQSPPQLRALKSFAALADRPVARPQTISSSVSVTVVGAGPAGLTAAWYLARAGAKVRVCEAEAVAGGMLAWAIPDFRLPPVTLQRDLDSVFSWGIDLKLGTRVDPDEAVALVSQGQAVILACGAPVATRVELPGANAEGVWLGLDFLRRRSLGPELSVEGPVVVVGGGNTALDAARSALRMVPDVTLAYRRERPDMPAYDEEIAAAEQEGLRIIERVEPEAFQTDARGRLAKIVLHETVFTGMGSDGRRAFTARPGTRHTIPAKFCVLGLGQETEGAAWARAFGIESMLPDNAGRLAPGLYGAGDLATGPSTVVEAMASGMACARAVLEDHQR